MIFLIADLIVAMDTYGVTEKQAQKWAWNDGTIVDIIIPYRGSKDKTNEYQRTEKEFNHALLKYNGMLLHASAISYQEKAYCFCAPSGTGKSTHTALWQSVYGKDAVTIINDDKPALRKVDGIWYVYGTPWSGKTDLSENVKVPLGGIFLLRQWDRNQADMVSMAYYVNKLSANISGPLSGEQRCKSLSLISDILETIPVWSLSCLPNEEAVHVAENAIQKWKEEHEA